MSDANRSLDVLGIKPVAEAISTVTKATTDGAGAFLSRICLPAAEELGLLLRDKVSAWRAKNLIAITTKAEAKFQQLPDPVSRRAHPRLVGAILENGSWSDDELVQNMWAGLLASGCTKTGHNQENLIFVSMLSQLTPSQAQVLQFVSVNSVKFKSASGLVVADRMSIQVQQIIELTGVSDVHTL